MRWWVLLGLLCCGPAQAQMELPPGTRSGAEPQAAVPVDPDAVDLAAAEAALEQGQIAVAVQLLETVTGRSSKSARAWFDLGYAREATGDTAGAAAAYRLGMQASSAGDVRSAVALGLLLARTGDRTGAETALTTAAATEGAEAALRARADRALARLAMPATPEKARDATVAALKLSPETAEDVLLTAEIADGLGDEDAAATAYARAIRMMPESAEATSGYGHLLLRQGKVKEAEQVLLDARRLHPEDAAVLSGLASVLLKEGRTGEAVPLLVRLHATDRANLPVTRLLAHTYAAQADWTSANPMYAELLAATPEDPLLLADWGDALIRQRRFPEAQAVLGKAVGMKDRFPTREALADAAGALAFAAMNAGDAEAVLRAGDIQNGVRPMDAKTAFLLALAHDRLHHTRKAEELYRQFLDLAHGSYPEEEGQARERMTDLRRLK